jgi:hypothetical protein
VTSHGEKKEGRAAKEVVNYKEEEVSEDEETMSEGDNSDEESDYEVSDGSDDIKTDSESGTDVEEARKRDAELLKRKRKSVQRNEAAKKAKIAAAKAAKSKPSTSKTSKGKTSSKVVVEKTKAAEPEVEKPKEGDDKGEENQFDQSQLEKEDEGGKKSKKKEAPVFNDKNVDYNLFNDAPENVMARKIKISNTVMVTCKMIDAISGGASGLSYDYAALTFVRKIQNAKAFEFNLPLTLVPSIIEALKLIVKDNPKFFKKHHHSSSME